MNDNQRQSAIDLLFKEGCSCVIRKGDEIRIFRERGVKDLFRLLNENPDFLDGSFVADKVVGKGAAALMVIGGVKELFADVISRPACDLLKRSHVKVGCTIEVPNIENRTKTGICPVEQACAKCRTAEECLPLIVDFLRSVAEK